MSEYKEMSVLVNEWVKEAGFMLRESLGDESINVSEKTNASDLVTDMDKGIEAFYVKKIREHFPEHKIFGEEGTYDEIDSLDGYIWIIDPIDGTLNYVKQESNFCSMIALFKDGEGVLAVIDDVLHEECYSGVKGEGVYCNDQRLEKASDHKVEEGLLAINTKMVMNVPSGVKELMDDALGIRLIGSAGLEMIQVLKNRVSAYITTPLATWDIAAGYMLAKELGLEFSRPDGSPIKLMEKNPIVIANQTAHKQIVDKFVN
ncbi:inositol monophosphatase family protein [Jeotgalibaca sp. MA1X17-3]|uniref:inositol monophosphatase family protein n=1 Tax=Jeotgalibaca sp. MA1X17-3 TaxID=2908211 RepID=UPI001F1E5083|nr:inositol monophosphatase family protein [Jeotgalibaca sp. MA1X17-3]UJF14975.1 inositol monophosphatase family protein [Jeotgalibaca sp. MA1X17-3]